MGSYNAFRIPWVLLIRMNEQQEARQDTLSINETMYVVVKLVDKGRYQPMPEVRLQSKFTIFCL